MYKLELKNGMIVETKNKHKWLVNNGKLLNQYSDFIYIDCYYYDDNEYEFAHPIVNDLDIIKIYNSCAKSIEKLFDNEYLDLIWNREDLNKIKIGDIVKIDNNIGIYEAYTDFFTEQNLPIDYAARYMYGSVPKEHRYQYKVLHIGQHNKKNKKINIAVIENVIDYTIYLVDVKGLCKVSKSNKNIL